MEKFEIKTLVFVLSCLFVLMGFFVLIFFWAYRKNQNAKETQIEKLNLALLQTQLEIQEQMLKTISQEIHDNVGQVLSLAKLNLNTINEQLPDVATGKIENSRELITKAISDLRDLSRSMKGDKVADMGLANAIENEMGIIKKSGNYKTGFTLIGEVFKLSSQKEILVFRIVQEALNNAIKHSNAANINSALHYEKNQVTVKITDDGDGFDPDILKGKESGIGLHNMKERAALIGAKFMLDSQPGSGTGIVLSVPLHEAEGV